MKTTLVLFLVASAAPALADNPPDYPGCHYLWTTNAYTSSGTSWCAHKLDDNSACGGADLDWTYAYAPLSPPAQPTLLVFLPGTGDTVDEYQFFMQEAAFKGYYVIGLPYQNNHPSDNMCGYRGECYGQLYHQLLEGVDNGFYAGIKSSGIVPGNNSIAYRLYSFLSFMKLHGYCQGFDWLQFWDGANHAPRWSKIVIAGHSHGGEVTTWATKNRATIAGITFEAPYANLDGDGAHGAPNAGSSLTPFSALPGCLNNDSCRNPNQAADYLTSGSWQNKLYVTLSDQDNGYDLSPGWLGHYMWNAAHTIGKTEQLTPASSFPSTSLNGHHWWTVQGTAGTGCSNGHQATVKDACVSLTAQNWLIKYWDLVLQSALP